MSEIFFRLVIPVPPSFVFDDDAVGDPEFVEEEYELSFLRRLASGRGRGGERDGKSFIVIGSSSTAGGCSMDVRFGK